MLGLGGERAGVREVGRVWGVGRWGGGAGGGQTSRHSCDINYALVFYEPWPQQARAEAVVCVRGRARQ